MSSNRKGGALLGSGTDGEGRRTRSEDPGFGEASASRELPLQAFRQMLDEATTGVAIDIDGIPRYVNRAYAHLFGYDSPDEILEWSSLDPVYAPRELERIRRYRRRRAEGRPAPVRYVFEGRTRGGEPRWVETHIQVLRLGSERLVCSTAVDVTSRRKTERALRESEARYRAMVEHAPEAIVVLDLDESRFVECNEKAARLFKLRPELLMQMSPTELSPPLQPDGTPSAEAAAALIERALSGEVLTFPWTHTDALGEPIDCEVTLSSLPSESRRLVRGSIVDVSRRLRAERTLLEKTAVLDAVLEHIDEGICIVDPELRAVAFNRRMVEMQCLDPDEFRPGDPFEKFLRALAVRGDYGPGDPEEYVRRRLADVARFRPHRFRRTRPNGRIVEARGVPLPGGGFVRTYRDVTETHELARRLSYFTTHDSLTGLVNRWEFERRLARSIDTASRGELEHAVCYLDLDQFKVVNDTCGHGVGDELLRQVAQTLQGGVRQRDTLARLGGDEFGILLERCPLGRARDIAGNLLERVEAFRFEHAGQVFKVGASIGLVPISGDTGSVADIMRHADAACYAAKEAGRNRLHVFHPEDEGVARHHGQTRWVARIRQALEENRFRLFAQRIKPLQGQGGGLHYEVLVRLAEEDGRLVPPGAFLPAAERYGLSADIDQWVVEQTFAWLAEHPGHLARLAMCSINLSGHSVGDPRLTEHILALLDTGVVPSERICFEITETAAVANLAGATRMMERLRGRGCRFALDDFGSGLSSFAYLKTLPVDYLKIDGLFVKDIRSDPLDLAMVRSINEVGHVLGKQTIAEFVEDDEIAAALGEIGVDFAQGYGIDVPRPIGELI